MATKRLLFALLLAVGTLLPSAGTAVARDPLTCGGYPEARTFVEAQSWWLRTPGKAGTNNGHGHLGACIPVEQRLTGKVHIDWVVKLHDNPGYLKRMFAEISTDANDGSATSRIVWTGGSAWKCPSTNPKDCTFTIPTDYDTALTAYDGREQLQYRMEIQEPDGNVMRPSVRFPAYLIEGKPFDDKTSGPNVLNTYGWYSGSGCGSCNYAFVRLDSGLPRGPVSGVWQPTASFVSTTTSDSVTHWFVSVDPSFHAMPPYPGVVYYQVDTSCAPLTRGCSGPRRILLSVDTTKLSKGPHKLFLRTDEQDPRGSTNSGAMVVPFTVSNP
jgi:hypothetical protein